MEGGIAILLLLLLAAGVGVFLVFFTSLGGALSLRRRSTDDAAGERPEHTHPTTPYHEHTTIAGTEDEGQRSEEQRR